MNDETRRAAAPSVEPIPDFGDVENRPASYPETTPRAASPEPTPGLREVFGADELALMREGHAGHKCMTAVWLATLDAASPAPERRVAPCDDEQLKAAFMKGVESAAEARALAASPAPEPTGLDAAWAEAEAALPEGWYFVMGSRGLSGYRVRACDKRDFVKETGIGPTPVAALRALAARLREQPDEGVGT